MQKVSAEQSPNTLPAVALDFYLNLAMEMGVIPNFWFSQEYLEKAGITVHQSEGWVWAEDEGVVVFPPLHPGLPSGRLPQRIEKVWSDFENEAIDHPVWRKSEFLDYEFIYDPKAFLDLSGGKWKVFRKNVKKWPKANPGCVYKMLPPDFPQHPIRDLLVDWLLTLEDYEIHDDSSLLAFAFHGENRAGLFSPGGKLVGLNVWDENWCYVNFRYCFSLPEEHLNSYLRLLFYTDPEIQAKNKLVNDGGVLDRPSLKFFKEKMNPLKVRKVYSHNLK